ncbi:MAG: PQQ-binding-like beta-propeller repeat protein [Pirellulales bacterium]|nr:PQQ-binding-like beta-propeller repeat protein [Pirellulales bacterium]
MLARSSWARRAALLLLSAGFLSVQGDLALAQRDAEPPPRAEPAPRAQPLPGVPPKQQQPAPAQPPAGQVVPLQMKIRVQGQANAPIAIVRGAQGQEVSESATFIEDRQTMQILMSAQELLTGGRFAEAVRHLGAILEAPDDFFFQPDKDSPIYHSLKAEAQRLIGTMPRAGRESYELQYGARARQMLDEAIAAGDMGVLSEVSRRFFHTQAGYDATALLATNYLDHGHPLAAALCYERLRQTPAASERFEPTLSVQLAACWLRAGLHDKAVEALSQLRAANPQVQVRVAGKDVPLFAPGPDAVSWLAEQLGPRANQEEVATLARWLMFRGGPSRNQSSAGGSPMLEPRWRVPTAIEPETEKLIDQHSQRYDEVEFASLPASHPLIVNGVVLMRTTNNLLAVDFRSGKRVWEVPLDNELNELLNLGDTNSPQRNQVQFAAFIEQRIWNDATYGTLSSDGEHVFSIEDLGVGGLNNVQQRVAIVGFNGRRRPMPTGPTSYNRLAAHDIRTGKLKWEVGGANGDGELELAGVFFLGPPLPLAGKLYSIVEQNAEIRLIALDAKTGHVEWSQQLAVVEQDITNDYSRRQSGVSPSYADGVLVCPTAAGATVAVDLTTRSLLWGYRFPPLALAQRNQTMWPRMAGVMVNGSEQNASNRWNDGGVVMAEGRVLLTPLESNELHCLNLIDGSLAWKRPRVSDDRGEYLYVAGVQNGRVLLVGRTQADALNLADGKSVWPAPLELGSRPSGYGFFHGERYFVPLSNAEVATINVATGKIEARSKSRSGHVPGNLVAYEGQIISQSPGWVEAYHELGAIEKEIAARLEKSPDDADALAQRGEILLHQGNYTAATEDLRRSYKLKSDPRTRDTLVSSLLEQLAADFSVQRELAPEIASLATRPEDIGTYLRVMATGFEKEGHLQEAFQNYLQLSDPKANISVVERVDGDWSVRRDRWVQARVAELAHKAGDRERQTLDEAIQHRLQAALADGNINSLRKFVAVFGSHETGAEARAALAEQLQKPGELLEVELLLSELAQGRDPIRARWAVARLAQRLREAGREDAAAPYFQRLVTDWADEVCLNGLTGRQLVEQLPEASTVRRRLSDAQVWPVGLIDLTHEDRTNPNFRYFVCEMLGPRGPHFRSMTVEVDQGQSIIGRDGLGQVRWRLPLVEPGQQPRFAINPATTRVKANGHLLLVSLGQQVLAIDTLGGETPGTAKLLWTRDIIETIPGMPMQQVAHAHQIGLPWGGRRMMIADSLGRPLGNLGPLTERYTCLQEGRKLVALEPVTGAVLWTRTDVEPGSDLFGDDEMLFVVAPNAVEALVLRPTDGADLGRRPIPIINNRMGTVGRHVLEFVQTSEGAKLQHQVRLLDLWNEKVIWQRSFDRALCQVIGEEAVGVVEPGHFTLLRLPDGATLVDAPIEQDDAVNDVYVLTSRDQYLLVASNNNPGNEPGMFLRPLPGGMTNNPLVTGYVYGFDRPTGAKQWSKRVYKQGLFLDQPSELPVLCFSTTVYKSRSNPNVQFRATTHVSMLCLDRRNGRTIYQEQLGAEYNAFELEGEPAKHTVDLKLLRKTVHMALSDKPIPADMPDPPAGQPEPAPMPEEADQEGRAAGPAAANAAPAQATINQRLAPRALENRLAPQGQPKKPVDEKPDDEQPIVEKAEEKPPVEVPDN